MSGETWTVSSVARMASVTVRTLHHYDEIGLLVPSRRSASGYRLYDRADLQRLHEILLFRQLGFALDAIASMLDDPAFDRRQALHMQREALLHQRRQTDAVLRAVDAALDTLDRGGTMDAGKMFEGFEDFDHAQYEDEARERWGHTDAWKESKRRTKDYTKEDWIRIREEADAVMRGFSELLGTGHPADSSEAMAVAEQHRQHIERWFYPCSRAMHERIAEMYTADPRFEESFEKHASGLAAYAQAAIRANAARD